MKKLILIFLIANGLGKTYAQCKLDYSNYEIVLEENFDDIVSVSDLSSRWEFQHIGEPGWGWGDHLYKETGEVKYGEYYDQSQVSLYKDGQNGFLRLTAVKLPTPVPIHTDWEATGKVHTRMCNYKSGMIQLKKNLIGMDGNPLSNEAGFVYGMFEIRMKVPKEPQAFPAFWLIGPTQFNVFEGKPSHNDRKYGVGYDNEWVDLDPDPDVTVHPGESQWMDKLNWDELGDKFHTYTGVWTPNEITFFFDGREIVTFRNSLVESIQYWGAWTQANSIIASMQMPGWGTTLGCHMDIDYIKVYKPIGLNYTLSYKSDKEYMHERVGKNVVGSVYGGNVSTISNSIVPNPNNPNEIFYRGVGNYVKVLNRDVPYGGTTIHIEKSLDYNDGPEVYVDGDIKYLNGHDKIIYVGDNGRINLFGRSAVEPCGFYHWYLRDDWWVGSFDLVKNGTGSLQVTPDGNDIFFIGKMDNKMHRYQWDVISSTWNHSILNHPPVYGSNTFVMGDIIIDPVTKNIIYKGFDNRLQTFWKDASGLYNHAYIDNPSNPSIYKINNDEGSITFATSISGVIYIGVDKKIQFYKWSGGWTHEWLPYAYSSPSLGYLNGDLAKSSIIWDDDRKVVFYGGFDGRIQAFVKTSTSWYHNWIDDYFNTDEFSSFNSTFGSNYSASIVLGAEASNKSIYYTAFAPTTSLGYTPYKYSELARFSYDPCEVLNPTTAGWRNLGKLAQNTGLNGGMPIVENAQFKIYPNPASTALTVEAINSKGVEQKINIIDITGRTLLHQLSNKEKVNFDISELAAGVYIVEIISSNKKYNFKLVKQ